MSTETLSKTRWVYSFGGGGADGDASMKNLLGGKGANLAEMSSLGLPVPPGFTITTEACVHYYAQEKQYPAELKGQENCTTVIVDINPIAYVSAVAVNGNRFVLDRVCENERNQLLGKLSRAVVVAAARNDRVQTERVMRRFDQMLGGGL